MDGWQWQAICHDTEQRGHALASTGLQMGHQPRSLVASADMPMESVTLSSRRPVRVPYVYSMGEQCAAMATRRQRATAEPRKSYVAVSCSRFLRADATWEDVDSGTAGWLSHVQRVSDERTNWKRKLGQYLLSGLRPVHAGRTLRGHAGQEAHRPYEQ